MKEQARSDRFVWTDESISDQGLKNMNKEHVHNSLKVKNFCLLDWQRLTAWYVTSFSGSHIYGLFLWSFVKHAVYKTLSTKIYQI
jgi:hypothetical protein